MMLGLTRANGARGGARSAARYRIVKIRYDSGPMYTISGLLGSSPGECVALVTRVAMIRDRGVA